MYNLLMNGFGWSVPVLLAIFIISVWDLVWKLLGMWKASKRNSVVWFVVLMIFNTVGILPILYIYIFSEWKSKKKNSGRRMKRRR
ncbi:MAG: DUF5652 family protein [archaeon]